MFGSKRKCRVQKQVEALSITLERMQISDYLRYLDNTKRLMWTNFLSGLMRGLGMAVGFTILGAAVVVMIQRIALENVPWIGDFLADIIRRVQENL